MWGALLLLSALLLMTPSPAVPSRNRNDVLQNLRARQYAVVQVADSERRLITTDALVRDVMRSRDPSKRILVVVPDSPAMGRYRNYFRTANPSISVGSAGGSLADSVLFRSNVTLVTAPSFVQELHRDTLRLDRLHLLVVDDVSQILGARDALRQKMRISKPSKIVGYRWAAEEDSAIQALERLLNGTSTTEDAQQAESPSTAATLAVTDLGLNSLEKNIFNASFPQAFVDKSLRGYRFKDPDLLIRAFLHPNFRASQRRGVHTSLEPLDYVGNFVLDFITSRHILKANGTRKGRMHDLKRRILCHKSCAFYAARNDFDRYVLIDDGKEKREMIHYATAARAATEPDGPRCFLSKFFKSVAGAIYVDSGYDPDVVEPIYLGLMGRHLRRILSS